MMRGRTARPPRPMRAMRRQQGIALVLALWMLVVLTVIAGSMAYSLRSELQVAASHADSARVEAAADAGVFRAILELARPATDPARWQGDGMPRTWQMGEISLRVVVVDEAAKADLNNAPAELLKGMFMVQGIDDPAASALADAILDWRDGDDLRQMNGAEKGEYAAAGKEYGPRNGNFESVEELRLVLGMTEEIFQRVARLVSVHSGRQGIDGAVAPRELLLALPGATPESVDAFVSQRQALLAQGLPVPAPPFAPVISAGRLGDTFSIQVLAILRDNATFFREAVVRVTPNPSAPFVILAWRAPRSGLGIAANPEMQPRQP